ncbi:hypothetical protein FQR65_LT06700 [Abscondita terminalis]|nr:hypothetical protein FQR65_LT06700 [Abscondita terminalis]
MVLWSILLFLTVYLPVALLLLKLYIALTAKWNHSPVCLVGKTAIVTGSNAGLGYYTALDFAKRGARVILACRNRTKAESAKTRIIEATGNPNVIVQIVDLSSLSSVRQFVKKIYETEDQLHILVNNAGGGIYNQPYTEDGLGSSMQINHFAPFLLTILLLSMFNFENITVHTSFLDLLKKSAPSRIVTVSSAAAAFGKLNVNNLNESSRYFTAAVDYANVKLCNLLFTIELAQKLEGTEVTANTLHPGVAKSDFVKDSTTILSNLLRISMKLFYKSTEMGAQTTIYVSIAKELNGISGKYFADCAETSYPRSARSRTLAKALWNKSEQLVKLTSEERQCLMEKIN